MIALQVHKQEYCIDYIIVQLQLTHLSIISAMWVFLHH